MTSALEGGQGSTSIPDRFISSGRTPVQLNRVLDGSELVWTIWSKDKFLNPAGIQTSDVPLRSPVPKLITLSRILIKDMKD